LPPFFALTADCHKSILQLLFPSLTQFSKQHNPYPSGVSDEKGLPQDGQVKAPWDSEFPLEPFFSAFLELSFLYKTH
jgi:hypothetical protein